ncbi:MAG TPA: LEPR-XLL domain-containing protein, partial [Desulfobulbaceae bacterium]|nr:LEPR-XLL domain-containing protein [Desulfobulbaceae bacterium]
MKKKIKRHLLLEQLEDRIFLSASPLAAVGPADHVAESEPVDLHAHDTLVPATETQHTAASDSGHVTPAGQEQPKAAETSESTNSANNMGAEHGNQSKPDDAEAIDNDHDNQADAQTVAGSVQQADQAAVSSETHGTQATDTGTADNADQAAGGVDTTIQTDSDTSAGIATDQVRDGQNADHESTTAAGENTPLSDAADPTTDHVNPDGTDTINTTDLADAGTDRADSEAADNTANNEVALADAADAVATDDQAIDPMIGEDFTFTTTFDNTTGSDVFGPYIDLLLDGGQDGSDAATDDGISFVSATYLNADVESTIIDITQNEVDNGITHPWATDNTGAPLIVHDIDGQTFHVGDQFVSLRMPFGSFTPDQPAAEVQVTAHMGVNADVDVNLGVHTTTGAMYGHDALDNPASDSPLRGAANGLAQETVHYKPEVITYRKDIIVPNVGADCQEQHAGTDDIRHFADDGSQIFEQNHQEIPTGPNFPATYVATIDVAASQTVTGLSLTEHLPDNIVYSGNVTVHRADGTEVTHSVNQSGNDLLITLTDDVTGTSSHNDVVITYDFYVPDVLEQDTGDDGHII